MFAYNELSDLLNGELVIPIEKRGKKILCLNSNNEEVEYSFSDFDFDKTIEERSFIVKDSSEDSSEEQSSSDDTTPKENSPAKEYSFDTDNEPNWFDKSEAEVLAKKFNYKPTINTKAAKQFEIDIFTFQS